MSAVTDFLSDIGATRMVINWLADNQGNDTREEIVNLILDSVQKEHYTMHAARLIVLIHSIKT